MSQADRARAPASTLSSRDARARIVEALQLDLVGPGVGHELADERLPGWERPSNWYLTGFLIPDDTPAADASDDDGDPDDESFEVPEADKDGIGTEERATTRRGFFPSSMGLSFLASRDAVTLPVCVSWGDYLPATVEKDGSDGTNVWQRVQREHDLDVPVDAETRGPVRIEVPESGGVELAVVVRTLGDSVGIGDRIPSGTRSVSIFVVNRRRYDEESPDRSYLFQPELVVRCPDGLVPRPDLRGAAEGGWDEQVADLHYADTPEFASGHGVSVDWHAVDGRCTEVRTRWIPTAEVEKTETAKGETVGSVELDMDVLGALPDGEAARDALMPLVDAYRRWIAERRDGLATLSGERLETADQLLVYAETAAERIADGIAELARDEAALDAFRVANRAVSSALKRRGTSDAPGWRAFQLAFLLLNLRGLSDPEDANRETVDLLFFPTGGGKTEAYLGLAAFAIVLRRLRHPGQTGAGVSVMMRYTLRLLTLDQLGRAAGLICALELERDAAPERYGTWPIEIGLWVGKGATPNIMGFTGGPRDTARERTQSHQSQSKRHAAPIPIESCPWCGTALEPRSFTLLPDANRPTELRVVCLDFECDFSGDRALPIVAVDETIYRRLPAFIVATVDKFAALPWTGEAGMLLGGAERQDEQGFYGPATGNRGRRLAQPLPPPDLIIQDELHLISGPLGTMAGLYETVIDTLCTRHDDARTIRPKIVASTATVRRADSQIQALFARDRTEIFPPPGPDRRDSFFARTRTSADVAARQYLGIAAQGRNPKVVFRRTWTALMAAAQNVYMEAGGYEREDNPADPYMTVLGYFNSLRELGGSRRILEEEVQNTLKEYGRQRQRIGNKTRLFRDRTQFNEVVELTSRVSTGDVAAAKNRLENRFHDDRRTRVDCAIATNMISVGLDITRLGLMVVFGQPKTHSEYIQATSRVGRDDRRPGLVVTLLNVHKPRDRSHYERFRHYHDTFYRSVEVASVTPFSSRAMDRGFAGALVALARHIEPSLSHYHGAEKIAGLRAVIESKLLEVLRERVLKQDFGDGDEAEDERQGKLRSVQQRTLELLDAWVAVAERCGQDGQRFRYQQYEPSKQPGGYLLREMLDTAPPTDDEAKFRANRSLRDVEPEVRLWIDDMGKNPLVEER